MNEKGEAVGAVGARIKQLRQAEGLTQTEFGSKLNVSKGHICQLEHELYKPSHKMLNLMILEFKVSPEWLLNGIGKMYTVSAKEGKTWIDRDELVKTLTTEFSKNPIFNFDPHLVSLIMGIVDKVPTQESYDYSTLADWYQNSIDDTKPPVWTDEHLEELLNDFHLIPKE